MEKIMMSKHSLSVHRRKLLASIFLVAVTSSLVLVPYFATTRAGGGAALFTYRAKWVCNVEQSISAPGFPTQTSFSPLAAETIGLVPGEYKTDINVHNPSLTVNLSITKQFVMSVSEPSANPGQVSHERLVNVTTFLAARNSMFITCAEILSLFSSIHCQIVCATFTPGTGKGFVTLTTSASSLDVVGEYSFESFNSTATFSTTTSPGLTSTGGSLDVERIPAQPFVP